jgi:hypothetical protein
VGIRQDIIERTLTKAVLEADSEGTAESAVGRAVPSMMRGGLQARQWTAME